MQHTHLHFGDRPFTAAPAHAVAAAAKEKKCLIAKLVRIREIALLLVECRGEQQVFPFYAAT